MTDLTPLFSQCVEIVSRELKADIYAQKPVPARPFLILDTFSRECSEVYENLIRLSTFTVEIRPLYLQINDEFNRLDPGKSRELSAADKQSIDEDFKVKIQKVYEKLKYLQAYEKKRGEVWKSKAGKNLGLISNIFGSEDDSSLAYHMTVAAHRMHILRFLSDTTQGVNTRFEQMQKQRYAREKLLNLLHIQNLDEEDDYEFGAELYLFDVQDDTGTDTNSDTQPELSQEQIQELSQENEQLLNMKTNQFKQVEKLHHSMVDIVKLQTELTMHLQTQALQIDTLLDNQDQIGVDLRMGNRDLLKATSRNKRGSSLIVTTCVVLGFLLLFVDYIS